MTMRWSNIDDSLQMTEHTTARACLYYFVRLVGDRDNMNWIAGRFWFGREVAFRLQFTTAQEARDHCLAYDDNASVWNADLHAFVTAKEEDELLHIGANI